MTGRNTSVHLRLLARGWPYRWWLLLTLAATAATTAMQVATPELLRYAVDTGFDIRKVLDGKGNLIESVAEGDMGTLSLAAALLIVVAVLRGVFQYAQQYLGEKIGQAIAFDFRNDIFDHLQRLSYAYHDNSEIGQIMSRATQDVEGVRMFVGMAVIRLISIVALVGVAAVLMFRLNVTVALVALAFMPVIAIQSGAISLYMRPMWTKVQDLHGQISTVLQENLTGMRVVKAFSREEHEQEKFDAKAQDLFDISFKTTLVQGINNPVMLSLWLLSMGLVFWVGAREISAGNMTPGDMVAFQVYLTLLQMPVRMLGFIVNMFARAYSAGTRIFEILDAESSVQEKPGAPPIRVERGEVEFANVSFGYDALASVLTDVNIHAAPGEMIALLGPTGSGKSTVVNLLPRFYDVTEGSLKIDGQDVRDVQTDSLRAAIGVVQQDVFLFPATIGDNIRYGQPGATDDEVMEAAKAARVHDYIDSMPDGYDTWVGERGTTLSGGQRQRVAIARTLLLNPRVLIFDDSTSSVDMRTEFLIQEALNNLMEGRTTFVIAQRLRTVQQADQIIVLRDGKVAERGTHLELLESGGLYREIYDLELRDQEEARAAVEPV
ncbi:MAG: ABC transporter ATP-binding protein [Dehalococcoidia bacterium]|jgi:ATP-binding cassette subfamily B protein|nr:ABC transporter ATP-binding protein [Dehalococcoidia bacterium]